MSTNKERKRLTRSENAARLRRTVTLYMKTRNRKLRRAESLKRNRSQKTSRIHKSAQNSNRNKRQAEWKPEKPTE